MRFIRSVMLVGAGFAVVVLSGSYLGALHPLGDSLAVFRDWIAYGAAAAGALTLLLVRPRVIGLGVIGIAAAALLHIASYSRPSPDPDPGRTDLIVLSQNLGAGRTDWTRLRAEIARSEADVIVLQEVTQQRMGELAGLLPDHPHQHICNFSGWSAMAVASRWPISQTGCTDHRSLAYGVVDAPGGAVWVASIHQVWPYPHPQAALLPDILDAVRQSSGRQVIAGDFNMVPWGHSVHAIAAAGETGRIGPVEPTIVVRGVGLPIDHVLTDGVGTVYRIPRTGSDHFGLVAEIVWP